MTPHPHGCARQRRTETRPVSATARTLSLTLQNQVARAVTPAVTATAAKARTSLVVNRSAPDHTAAGITT